jgi:hypothetical protein
MVFISQKLICIARKNRLHTVQAHGCALIPAGQDSTYDYCSIFCEKEKKNAFILINAFICYNIKYKII